MKIVELVLIYLFSIGCSAEKPDTSVKLPEPVTEGCTVSQKESAPKQVLVGTDIVEETQFGKTKPGSGIYSIDMGGASVTVEVAGKTLKRVYAEPGMEKIVKNYSDLCIQNNLIDGAGVRGVFVAGGFLLWEQKSGDAMIPADMWVYLKKEN